MKAKKERAYLRGMNEELADNEEYITYAMPFIECSTQGRFAAVRRLGWECESGEGLAWLSSEDDLREVGTYFNIESPLPISNDQVVALLGPKFFRNLEVITTPKQLKNLLKGWVKIQDDFSITCISAEEYDSLAEDLANLSKRVFDNEISQLTGNYLSPQAKAAIELIYGNAATKPEELYQRALVAAKVERDPDSFRDTLEFAAIDLGETTETLKAWVRDYLELRQPALLRGSYQEALVTVGMDFDSLVEKGHLIFVDLLRARLQDLNGQNPKKTGEKLGRFIATWATDQSDTLPDNYFQDIWKEVIHGKSIRSEKTGLFLAHLLRAHTITLAFYQSDDQIREEDRMLERLYRSAMWNGILTKADSLSEDARAMGIKRLTVAVDEFPECRLLIYLLDEIMDQVRGIRIHKKVVDYSDANYRDIDFRIVNELCIARNERKNFPVIFKHLGYYAFISRDYLIKTKSDSDKVPDYVKKVIDICLLRESRGTVPPEEELNGRSWLAIDAGISNYLNSEYNTIVANMQRRAGKESNIPVIDDDFTDGFEAFVQGVEEQVFMGGSIHARLLQEWWISSGNEEIIELLGPKHVETLLQRDLPFNRLRYGDPLLKEGDEFSNLRECLKEVLLDISKFLDTIAKRARAGVNRRNLGEHTLLQRFMRELATGQRGYENLRWSFITSKEAMIQLLLEDNDFGAGSDTPDSERSSSLKLVKKKAS